MDDTFVTPVYETSPEFNKMYEAAFAPAPVAPAVEQSIEAAPMVPDAPSGPVNVISPSGELQSIDASHVADATKNGYRLANPEEVDRHFLEQDYGTPTEMAKTALEGAASAATFGLSTSLEKSLLGVKDEDILARRAVNPGSHALGQVAGLVGSTVLLPGAGAAGAMEAAGAATAKALGLGAEGAGLLSRIGAKTVSEATQMAIFQAGDEVSKKIANDPEQSVGTALADIGLASLVGGGVGAALGTAAPLWKATVGDKLGKTMADFKGRLEFNLKNPNPSTAVADELSALYNATRGVADEVYGATGLKSQEIQKLMPELTPAIEQHSADLIGKSRAIIEKMKAEPDSFNVGIVRDLERTLSKAEKALNPEISAGDFLMGAKAPKASAAQHFEELNALKQKVQELSKFEKRVVPGSTEAQVIKEVKGLGYELRKGLEDPQIWGKAGERQQVINKAFSEYLPALKDFEKKFTVEVAGERMIDPGKVQTYMNQLDKASSEIKKDMLGNFIEASEKYRKVIGATQANLGLEQLIPHTPLTVTSTTLAEKTVGEKLADQLVHQGLAEIAGRSAGAAMGAGIGGALGSRTLGGILGERILGPGMEKALRVIAPSILNNTANASSIKAGLDYVAAVYKGETAISKAAKQVFKQVPTGIVSGTVKVNDRAREKLDGAVMASRTNPESLLSTGQDLSGLMPAHGAGLAQTASNALNYLSSIRPETNPKMPLDSKLPPDPGKLAEYNRALDIANQPLGVIPKIAAGTITPKEIQAVRTMYPGLYNNITEKLMTEMTDRLSKGEAIPYRTKIGLSLWASQPLDSTMTPMAINLAQPAPPAESPPQGAPNQLKPPPASSVKNMNKLPSTYATPEQARAQRSQRAK